jgi:YD repeat-containing protein
VRCAVLAALPTTFVDPFNQVTTAAYDASWLTLTRVTDALDHTVQVETDYRVVAPALLTDANGNRSAVRFDELGVVVASAVMGKAGDADGDTLDDPTSTFDYGFYDKLTGQPNVAC